MAGVTIIGSCSAKPLSAQAGAGPQHSRHGGEITWPRRRSICAGSNVPCRRRARKALAGLKAGDILIAECTDPLTAIDIPNLVNQTGDMLEASSRNGEGLVFRIRKS
jgi:tRNA 2-thiouridine synthesizing protein A